MFQLETKTVLWFKFNFGNNFSNDKLSTHFKISNKLAKYEKLPANEMSVVGGSFEAYENDIQVCEQKLTRAFKTVEAAIL